MLKHFHLSPELRFTAPVMLENIAITLAGLIFSSVVSGLSTSALAAVGLVNMLMNLLVAIAAFAITGSSVLVARLVGEGEWNETSRAVEQAVWLAVVFGVAMTAFCEIFSVPIMRLLLPNAEPTVFNEGLTYCRALCLSFPFLMVCNVISGMLRAAGQSGEALIGTLVMHVVQLLAGFVMMSGLGWGVAGAGLAFVVCRIAGAALLFVALLKSHRHFAVQPKRMLKPCGRILGRIVRLGLPVSGESASVHACYLICNSMAMGLGALEANAFQVVTTIATFPNLLHTVFGTIGVTFVGQALGAGQQEKAKEYQKKLLWSGLILMAALGLIVVLVSPWLVPIYTKDPAVQQRSVQTMWLWFAFTIPGICINVNDPILRTGGEARAVMIYNAVFTWGLRVPLTWLFCYVLPWGAAGVWLANVASVTVRAAYGFVWVRRGKWLTKKV